MEKSHYNYAVLVHYWLNFTERLAQAILYRRPYEGVTLEGDIAYGKGKQEVVDFIYPTEKSDKKTPVMLYIHGGGWISGVKNMRRTYCYEYASRGYFVANIDYMWSPKIVFPAPLQQCLDAIDFVLDNAEKYNLDTDKIAFAGESAGVYFGFMLSLIANHPELLKVIGLRFKHADTFKIIVNMFNCGAFDMRSLATSNFPNMAIMVESFTGLTCADINSGEHDAEVDKLCPLNYVGADFPPTYMLYAARDPLRKDSFSFKERLDTFGVPNGIYKCDGPLYGNHAFAVSTVTKTGKEILKNTLEFVNKYVFDACDSAEISENNQSDEGERA